MRESEQKKGDWLQYNITELCTLLEQKKALLLRWTAKTEEMFFAPVERLAGNLAEREALLHELETVEARIGALCEGDDTLQAALAGNSGDIPPALAPVSDRVQSLRACVSGLLRSERSMAQRLQQEKNGLLEKIKGMQAGGAAAGQYHRAAQTANGVRHKKVPPKLI